MHSSTEVHQHVSNTHTPVLVLLAPLEDVLYSVTELLELRNNQFPLERFLENQQILCDASETRFSTLEVYRTLHTGMVVLETLLEGFAVEQRLAVVLLHVFLDSRERLNRLLQTRIVLTQTQVPQILEARKPCL